MTTTTTEPEGSTGLPTCDTSSPDHENASDGWVEVCAIEVIVPDSGVCALVNGEQVAVFRLEGGAVFAVGNIDPFSNSAVISRGIVGDSGGIPIVASPVYKQSFDLRTGICLDDTEVCLPVFNAQVIDGIVEVRPSADWVPDP